MNEPVISPWLIYLIGIAPSIDIVAAVLATAFFCLSVISVIATCAIISEGSVETKTVLKFGIPISATTMGMFFLFLLTVIAIPDRKWIIATFIANETTVERVSQITDTGKDLKNELKQDFIDVLNAVTGEELSKKDDSDET